MEKIQTTWQRARRPEQKEERRTAILEASATLFDAEGIEGTGLNAIARAVGISKPNLYRYFESREAILLQLLLREHRACTGAFRRKLERLGKTNDVEAVAEVLAESLSGRKRYLNLGAALATVLEHNVGFETITEFKRKIHRETESLASAFQATLPGLSAAQAYSTLAMLLMAASGMWPHCHPAPVVQEILRLPEFAPMRFDFKTMMRDHAVLLLRGQLS